MTDKSERKQITPIKLTSLREQRDIIRSNSNRPRLVLSPIFEIPKPSSDKKLKLHNRSPVLSRFRKFDSPKSIYEEYADTSIQLIEKTNAAMEVLEILKEKSKQSGLLFKRDKNEKTLKPGIGYRSGYRNGVSGSPDLETGLRSDRKLNELDFMEESKQKKLTKEEAKNLISRLQGGVKYYKKH